jgi:hypothetical protein
MSMTVMEIVQTVQMSNGMTVEHLEILQMTVRCGTMPLVMGWKSTGLIATMALWFGS